MTKYKLLWRYNEEVLDLLHPYDSINIWGDIIYYYESYKMPTIKINVDIGSLLGKYNI